MGWFELTVIYVVFMVLAALLNKKALNIEGLDEIVFGASVQLFTGIICLFLALLTGFRLDLNITSIMMLFGLVVTYVIAVSLFFYGLKRIDLSMETILSASGSVWSLLLGATFLSEAFSLSKAAGVGLIMLACIIVFWNKRSIRFGKYEQIILVSAFFYALGAVWDKKLNEFGTALSFLAISFGLVGTIMLVVHGKRTLAAFNDSFRRKEFWKGSMVIGLLYAAVFWALFEAYQRGGEVSRMFPITLSTSVFIPLLGILLLKERSRWQQKTLALAVLIMGLILIRG